MMIEMVGKFDDDCGGGGHDGWNGGSHWCL